MHVVIPKSPKRSPSNFIKVVFTLEAIQTVSKQASLGMAGAAPGRKAHQRAPHNLEQVTRPLWAPVPSTIEGRPLERSFSTFYDLVILILMTHIKCTFNLIKGKGWDGNCLVRLVLFFFPFLLPKSHFNLLHLIRN